MRTALSIAVGTTFALMAPAAFAQDAAVGASGSVDATGTLPPPRVTTTTTTQSTTTAAAKTDADDGVSDHEKYAVGHFAIGYLGLTAIPLDGVGTLSAPVIGGRYWLTDRFGIDAGIGLALTSGSSSVTAPGGAETKTDDAGKFGLALHGGVPIALAHQKHYKFLVVPELNIAFAHSSEAVPNQNDISHNGFHLDIGARAGAEIHFGFVGLPQLALQATIGAYFRHDNVSRSQDTPNGTAEASVNKNAFGTSVQSDPWALFTNNISALYYFP